MPLPLSTAREAIRQNPLVAEEAEMLAQYSDLSERLSLVFGSTHSLSSITDNKGSALRGKVENELFIGNTAV